MSELGRIAKDIEKRKNLEINLPKYMNTMLTSYHRYAYIHLALNYYTCGAVLTEERGLPSQLKELAEKVNAVIRDYLLVDGEPEALLEGIEAIDKVRSEIIRCMHSLTAYTDSFQIYEYVLNRLEYRFCSETFPPGYSDEAFVQKLKSYILSDRDTVVVHMKLSEVTGQLPVRMTRQRFFEIVRESFTLYLGNEKGSLEDMLYMLRTCAALSDPQGLDGFEELERAYRSMKEADFAGIGQEKCGKLKEKLAFAVDFISRMSNLCVMLEEVVNDVYMLLLSMPYALTEMGEAESCKTIIRHVLDRLESGAEDAFETEEEGILESFGKLEGRQERLYEQFSQNDYLLDSMDELEDTMKSIMVDKLYYSLKQMAKLASSSRFIELNQERQTEPVDEEYLEHAFKCFMEEMEAAFRGQAKLVNRARMAAVLISLPSFFRSMDEFLEYAEQSLVNCSDEREKLASVTLLQELMRQ